jgi:hypothetical protein
MNITTLAHVSRFLVSRDADACTRNLRKDEDAVALLVKLR